MDIQQQPNVGRRPKLAAEGRREIGRPAVAVADRLHRPALPSVEGELRPLEPPIVQVADGGGTAIERLEMVTAERPACIGHARPRLEIDRVQRPALGGPSRGAAAEHAKARLAGGEALATDVPPVVQQLRGVPEGLAAAGEHRHPRLAAGKLPRQRDARRPSAQDAQVGLDGAAILQLAGMDQCHRPPRPSSGRPRMAGGVAAPSLARTVGARSRMSPDVSRPGTSPAPAAK